METVLVTGGAGFIGSHTCKALAASGWLPVAFDDLSRGHADFVRWGPLVKGDILETAALDAAFEQHRPGAVIHFAALAYVGPRNHALRQHTIALIWPLTWLPSRDRTLCRTGQCAIDRLSQRCAKKHRVAPKE